MVVVHDEIMDHRKICRVLVMLVMQHVLHCCMTRVYCMVCAYSIWGSIVTHGSYVCLALEEFNSRKLGMHTLMLIRELGA